MKNRTLLFALTLFIANLCFAQKTNYIASNAENIFYSFDKKDSTITFKIKYVALNDSYIVTDLDLSIEIDSLIDIRLREIPYNFEKKEFEVHIPRDDIRILLTAKNVDLHLSVRQIGDTDMICLSNAIGILSEKIIHENIK